MRRLSGGEKSVAETKRSRFFPNGRAVVLSVFSLVLCLIIGFEAAAIKYFYEPVYHYDVRRDMSVYFSNADEVIAAVRRCLKRHDWKIGITFSSHSDNMDDISDIVREVMEYAVSETDDPTEGDYIRYQYGGYDLNYSHECSGDTYSYDIEIIPNYYTTPEQEEKVTEKINDILKSFSFNSKTTDYEKFTAIYNYVFATVEYDRVHKNNGYNHLKTTAYSALFYKRAVCQGYAVLMYRMLRESGIDSRVITGTAQYEDGEEYHAWNIVKLGGVYYNFDITWDKQSEESDYFLKCDSGFEAHVRDEMFSTVEFYERYPMADRDFFG